MDNYTHTCCYCGKKFVGWGNNPDTWDEKEWKVDDRCCDKCNTKVVVPRRLAMMKKISRNEQ